MSLGYIINLIFYVFVVCDLWVSSETDESNAILSEDWEETCPKFETKLGHFLFFPFPGNKFNDVNFLERESAEISHFV